MQKMVIQFKSLSVNKLIEHNRTLVTYEEKKVKKCKKTFQQKNSLGIIQRQIMFLSHKTPKICYKS